MVPQLLMKEYAIFVGYPTYKLIMVYDAQEVHRRKNSNSAK